MGAAAICIVTMHFLFHRCVPYRGHNIPTKFGGYLAFSTPCLYYVSKSQYPY